jgi:hypothetical protein
MPKAQVLESERKIDAWRRSNEISKRLDEIRIPSVSNGGVSQRWSVDQAA